MVSEAPADLSTAEEGVLTQAAASDAGAAEALTEAEQPLIEIWRPGRRPHRDGPRPDRNRARAPRRESGGPRHARPVVAGEAALAETPVDGVAPVTTGEAPGGRPPRPDRTKRFEGFKGRSDSPRPDNRPGGEKTAGQKPAGNRFDKNRPDKGRPDRRPDSRNDRPFASTERPAAREKQPDPNSPFAKLLALKAELESKARKE